MKAASIVLSRFSGILAVAGIAASPQTALSKTVTADTVVSSLLCADSISCVLRQDTLATKTFHATIGPISLSGIPAIFDTFALAAGSNGVGGNLTLAGIDSIVFDSSSTPLSVTVRNLSAATISGCAITIIDSIRNTVLGPYDSATLSFPVAGMQIAGGSVGVSIAYTASDTATMVLGINFNGPAASMVRALDNLIPFQKTSVFDYEIGDSLDIKYIDIQNGAFRHSYGNYAQIPIRVQAELLHLWSTLPCAQRNIDSSAAIAAGFPTHADSLTYYWGNLTNGFVEIQPGGGLLTVNTSSLSGTRLFPLWDPGLGASGMSICRIVFTISNPRPRGDMVTLKSTDSLLVVVAPQAFHYKEMLATVMREYVREGDTAKVKVPVPWDAASSDSLGKDVRADISMTVGLPDSSIFQFRPAQLDTLGFTDDLFSPDVPAVNIESTAKFLNVRNNMICMQQADITSLMSLWPDSIYIAVKTTIPVGTRVLLVNEQTPVDPDYGLYMGRMNIRGNYTVNIYELTGVIARDIIKPFNSFDVQYANSRLIISIPQSSAGPTEVSLYSLSGRCIEKVSFSGRGKIAVPLERKLGKGAYSARVSNRSGICTRKIVVR